MNRFNFIVVFTLLLGAGFCSCSHPVAPAPHQPTGNSNDSLLTNPRDTVFVNDTLFVEVHSSIPIPTQAIFIYSLGDGDTLRSKDSIVAHVYNRVGIFIGRIVLFDTVNHDTLGGVSYAATVQEKILLPLALLQGFHTLTIKVSGAQSAFDYGMSLDRTVLSPLQVDDVFSSLQWDSASFSQVIESSSTTSASPGNPFNNSDSSAAIVDGSVDQFTGIGTRHLHIFNYSSTTEEDGGGGDPYSSLNYPEDYYLTNLTLISSDSAHITLGSNASTSLQYSATDFQVDEHEVIHNFTAHDTIVSQYPVSVQLEFTR